MLGLTSKRTRAAQARYRDSAVQHGSAVPEQDQDSSGPGVREWLAGLPAAASGQVAAAFDTRLDKRLAGGAAPRIARRLRQRGFRLAADPEGFIVEDMAGPLRASEQERAEQWGASLTIAVSPAAGEASAR